MFFFVDTSFVCASKELQETKKKGIMYSSSLHYDKLFN